MHYTLPFLLENWPNLIYLSNFKLNSRGTRNISLSSQIFVSFFPLQVIRFFVWNTYRLSHRKILTNFIFAFKLIKLTNRMAKIVDLKKLFSNKQLFTIVFETSLHLSTTANCSSTILLISFIFGTSLLWDLHHQLRTQYLLKLETHSHTTVDR